MLLVHIIDCPFEMGVFSVRLKLSIVRLNIKNNDSQLNLNNFRPISILSTFSKLVEKLNLLRLDSFLDSRTRSVFYTHKYGFREGLSTNNAIFSLLDDRALNGGEHLYELFLDLSEAFDVVDYALLL